jgi:hypothetical protein
MTYWAMQTAEGTLGVFLPDRAVSNATHRDGINPDTVRKVLIDAGASEAKFQLVAKYGEILVRYQEDVRDLLFWSWIPIFSGKGRDLAISHGGDAEDFWPCRFESNPKDLFHLHLPKRAYDVVDIPRSKFLMFIPNKPPIPFHIQHLALRDEIIPVPPCFRYLVPGNEQMSGDLLVTDDFKKAWQAYGLSGADFRNVSQS